MLMVTWIISSKRLKQVDLFRNNKPLSHENLEYWHWRDDLEIAHNECNRGYFRIFRILICGYSDRNRIIPSYPDGNSYEKPESIQTSASEK